MSEDAVSPVVAAMLILAVVVTFFAAWNAYFVPSMKAQSEITHIGAVESGFLKFSSDIETAAALKRGMKLSEPIPLGGGDFLFDPAKSGGELRIYAPSSAAYLRLNATGENDPANPDQDLNLIAFSYKPVNNFWQNQGYGWTNGVIYVFNNERNLTTPLKFANTDDITYGLTGSLIEMEPSASYSSPGNCSSITVRVVNITPDPRHFRASGNGNGMLTLESTARPPSRLANATSMNLSITSSSGRFSSSLWESLNASVNTTLGVCGNVMRPLPSDPNTREIQLTFSTAPYPNLTLIREISEITVGAY